MVLCLMTWECMAPLLPARLQWRRCPGLLSADCRAVHVARRGTQQGSRRGKPRQVLERTFAWLHQFKRLRIHYEIRRPSHRPTVTRLQRHLFETAPNLILKRSVSHVPAPLLVLTQDGAPDSG